MPSNPLTALALATGLALAAAAPAAAQTAPAAYEGLKKTVSVDPFLAADAVGGSVTADGMTAMLIEALNRDGRFVVVERPATADPASVIPASAVVRAAVTKYEPAASGGSLGIGGVPLGSLLGGRAGLKSQRAVMEISLRLVDATTGQVVSTSSAAGSATASSAEAALVHNASGASGGGTAFRASPIGQAGSDAIRKAVDQIASGMRGVPWSALVVQAEGPTIYVSAGADRNVRPGAALHVYRKAKVLTDPTTGEVLDVELQRVGAIRIETVRDRISTATLTEGESPARGDLVRAD